jgi:sugar phosphate isomerase/epimerase
VGGDTPYVVEKRMQIGIFAKTFVRASVDACFDAIVSHDITCVQFNLACCGLPSMPDRIDPDLAARVGLAAGRRRITIAAVSGTFNMIHPDPEQRQVGLRRLAVLAGACREIGTSLITLCTGSRNPDNMWRRHPDNDTTKAWEDLRMSMQEALRIAEDHDIRLGIEPEVSNTVDSAAKARRLLDEMGSPRLKIVMDGSNLFHSGELPRMREILDEAFELLGRDIAIAHAKDLNHDGDAGHEAAGTGVLDYDYYIALLRRYHFDGPLILHNLTEAQVPGCVAFLRTTLNAPIST